jgi:putative tryptophan/tyrosine transport system permease protein
MIDLILQIFELGSIYSLLVLAVHITSNIIGIDDFSIEGSFALGGAICIFFAPYLSIFILIPISIFVGTLTGLVTTILFKFVGIDSLLSGIIITTGLFSCNLKIAGPQASLDKTLFDITQITMQNHWIILIPIAILMVIGMGWFLKTEIGLCLRAVGDNPHILVNISKSPCLYLASGLIIANSLAAFAGLLFVNHTGFFSITGNIGTLIIALAGMIIGQTIFKSWIGGAFIGAVIYQAIISIVIYQQFNPIWNKLITAIIIVFLILLKHLKKSQHQRELS